MVTQPKARNFDDPRAELNQDLLDRAPLAHAMFRALVEVDADWSVRVGLHGQWGSGKTTVLNFIRSLAKEQEHIIVDVNAWEQPDEAAMRQAIRLGIFKALKHRVGLAQVSKGVTSAVGSIAGRLAPVSATVLGDSAAAIIEKVGDRAATIGVDDEDFRSMLAQLVPPRRVIVIIDDLDRARPSIISPLLFELREVLSIPSISFLLAFDRERVVAALRDEHPGFDSDEFLDKIIDLPFFLSKPSREQLLSLALADLAEHCPEASATAITAVQNLLPESPRKVRLIIRKLRVLRAEIRRHSPDEIDVTLLLLLMLLDELSPSFFRELSSSKDTAKVVSNCVLSAASSRVVPERQTSLDHMIKRAGAAKESELIMGIINQMSEGGAKAFMPGMLLYHAQLLTRPHTYTNKELDALFERWKSSGREANVIVDDITEKAKRRGVSAVAAADEVFNAAMDRYELTVDSFQHAKKVVQQTAAIQFASSWLKFASSMAAQTSFFTEPTEQWLRLAIASEMVTAAIPQLASDSSHVAESSEIEKRLRHKEMRADLLLGRLVPRAHDRIPSAERSQTIQIITNRVVDDWIGTLTERGRSAFPWALFKNWYGEQEFRYDPKSPLWSSGGEEKLIAALSQRPISDAMFDFSHSFLIGFSRTHYGQLGVPIAVIRSAWDVIMEWDMPPEWNGFVFGDLYSTLCRILSNRDATVPLPLPLKEDDGANQGGPA